MKSKSIRFGLLLSVLLLCVSFPPISISPVLGAQEKQQLKDIKISGNVRVEEDGIRLHLKQRPGDVFDAALVEQDVKAIFRMGFFDDVQAELAPDGVLIYKVKEKPYIREVKIQGNSQVARDKIETALGVAPRTVLERSKVAEGIEKVRKLYGEQGYVNASVDYAVSVESNNQAVVTLDIREGSRLLIKRVSFEGNRAFSESDLKSLISTKEEWLFSFITNRGVLDRDILTNDLAIVANHYYDNGYIDHKLDEPVIVRARDGLEVVIRVTEGEQYRIAKVEIGGELIQDGKQILKEIKVTPGQIFRGSRLRDDITTLTNMYTNRGYAFVQIDPVTKVDPTQKHVEIQLLIKRGPPVYFNRVLVAGNTKTRDHVVRRELTSTEQELYSGNKITQSRNALQRTGYFEDVQVSTKKTDQPDTVDVLVDVKEGPTGNFSIGAGFSSGDGFLFNATIAEKNLMGRGQGVNGAFSIGSSRQDFSVSFTEPYFRGSDVSMGVDAFNTKREFNDFDEKKLGFGVRSSYPLKNFNMPFFGARKPDIYKGSDELASNPPVTIWDYMRGGVSYELTRQTISGIDDNASQQIKDEEGRSLTSAVTPSLSYDSRDHFFNPTEGTRSSLSTKFAGLGGDTRFIKSDLTARWHYPLMKDPGMGGAYVLALGGTLGYGIGFSGKSAGDELPLFERYFLGGINSVRGFAERSLGPRSCDGSVSHSGGKCSADDVLGGSKAAVINTELLFPIAEQYGLRGVAFFDMGNSFSESFDFGDLRKSVGVGARWMSPFGPLRVELGFPLDKKPGDETSVLGFSIGSQP